MSALLSVAPPNTTPLASVERSRAPVRFAPEKLAPLMAESLRSAFVRSAPAKLEAWNLASRRLAPIMFAPEKLAPTIRAPERFRPESSHFTQEPPNDTCRGISFSPAHAPPAAGRAAKAAAEASRKRVTRIMSGTDP